MTTNETRRDQVQGMILGGMCDADIGRAIGVSRERIRQLRQVLGLPKHPTKPPPFCSLCGGPRCRRAKASAVCAACWRAELARRSVTLTCAECGKPKRIHTLRLKRSKTGLVFCTRAERAQYQSRLHITGWKPGQSGNPMKRPATKDLSTSGIR